MTIIAAMGDPTVIAEILKHLGMSAGTAPSAGAQRFDDSKSPDPNPSPVHLPEPTIPLGLRPPETPKPSEP